MNTELEKISRTLANRAFIKGCSIHRAWEYLSDEEKQGFSYEKVMDYIIHF